MEAVRLLTQLRELERKRSDLQKESEERSKLTPEEERERLLQQVKQDNQQIALLQERLSRTQDQVQSLQADINQVDKDMEEVCFYTHRVIQDFLAGTFVKDKFTGTQRFTSASKYCLKWRFLRF